MRIIVLVAIAALTSACASSGGSKRQPAPSALAPATPAPSTYQRPCSGTPATPEAAYECDRRSILGMVGDFRVKFAFDETLALKPGYKPREPQRSGGDEFVFVVEDRGDFIALQHILVAGSGKDAMVIKHWRQDWQFQPKEVLVFRGNNHFALQAIAADKARGAWSQSVYEVDDAPRYAGVGRWDHSNGVDAWTSDFTWRPLPRREYTKRNDYQVLGAINRHTLTPGGWMHEQDNQKLQLAADGKTTALVREVGINSYERSDKIDFGPGREYWKKTAAFWSDVRKAWSDAAQQRKAYDLRHMLDERPRFEALFALADKAGKGESVSRGEIDAVLERALAPDAGKAAASAALR